jgi:hypothetical protein
MASRLELHNELLSFVPNVYFQPPSNTKMMYPCITYSKTRKMRHFASDVIYLSQQEYALTVIDSNPDNDIADRIEKHFQHCSINQCYAADNLSHTNLSLYY